MYLIRKDVKNNRLYITLTGVITMADGLAIKEQIIKEISELKPGFDTINDISKFIRADENGAPILNWIINFQKEKKVNRIVRIIGTSKAGLLYFAKHTPPEETDKIKCVPTLREAEDYLNESASQNQE